MEVDMMRGRLLMIVLGGLLIVAFGTFPDVFAHGDGENEAHTEPAMIDSSNAAVAVDSAKIALDSAYATIQVGFVKLNNIFEKGCFDCHTDRTKYPWYHSLPFVKSLIDGDIKGAHRHMDMTNGFPFKGHDKPADQLVAIYDEIEGGDMPPLTYRMMHWSAKPSEAEKDSVFQWIDSSLALLKAHGQVPEEEEHDNDEM
jgi:hypothetical protein